MPDELIPMLPWQVLQRRIAYSAPPWVEVALQKVKLPNGQVVDDYHEIRLQEFSMVYAETLDFRVITLRQYRHGVRATTLSLPAGLIQTDEDPLVAAQRELLEETGYQAEHWIPMGSFCPNSNYGCGRAHLFRADGATKVAEPHSDDLEETELLLLSPDELFEWFRRGDLLTLSVAAAISFATHPKLSPRIRDVTGSESERP